MPRRVSSKTISDVPPSDTGLVSKTRRLQRLAQRREQSYRADALAQGLTTRRDELKSALQRADALAKARAVLARTDERVVANALDFGRLATHVAQLRASFADDPASLTLAGAYRAAEVTRALDAAHEHWLRAWQRHIRAAGPTRLVAVLERFGLHNAARELHEIGDRLERLSAILPRDLSALEQVAQLKSRSLEIMSSSHLAEDIDFLEQAMNQGAPLSALLEDPQRVERLRQHGILPALRVVAS